METLKAAVSGGAAILVLCDTNGGTMPDEVAEMTARVVAEFKVPVGIHCHNDAGLAVANSLLAVKAGATEVQGTLIGFGERTGNANLSTVIADLELKMGIPCLPEGKMADLTPIARRVAEIDPHHLARRVPRRLAPERLAVCMSTACRLARSRLAPKKFVLRMVALVKSQ